MTRKWIGFSEALAERREKRFQNNTPQPWVVRKLTIGFVVALVGWAWYVYIGRFCVPLIRGDVGVSGALGGKGLGIAFLAVFCFLGLMFWWSYIKVITTSPGYARDHVQKSSPPTPTWHRPHNQPNSPNWDLDSGLGMPYESMPPPALSVMPTPPPPSMFNTWGSNEHRDTGIGYPPTPSSNISQQQKYEAGYNNHSTSRSRSPENMSEKRYDMGREDGVGSGRLEETETMGGMETGAMNGMNGLGEKMLPPSPTATKRDSASTFLSNPKLSPLPPPSPSNTRRESQSRSQSQSRRQGQGRAHDSNQSRHGHDPERKHSSKPSTKSKSKPESHSRSHSRPHHSDRKPQSKPQPLASLGLGPAIPERQPSQKPVLAAEYRYCARDEHLKPMRTHHCRICGTCVLKYDHHCPWIGQCVGAFNHKFFLNFAQWSTLWTGWIFGTLVAQNAHVSMNGGDVDVQELIIIALSGLFTIFTFTLSIAHALLILKNETTVEALMAREQKEDEDAMLQARFGVCRFRTKRRVRKAWDLEWGKVKTEGNLWWLGSGRRNWEATMGRRVWTWFLPVGGPEGDGMVFARNPRFDEQGRLMRREMWPKELQ